MVFGMDGDFPPFAVIIGGPFSYIAATWELERK